jgi:hypothetical protein
MAFLLGGGLEPRFRVLFSAIFHGVPSEIAIRVENRRFWRKQNCCKLLQVYIHFVCGLYLIGIARPVSVVLVTGNPRDRPSRGMA